MGISGATAGLRHLSDCQSASGASFSIFTELVQLVLVMWERRASGRAAERARAQALSTLWLGDGTFGTTNIAWDGWRDVFVQTRADNATFLQARSILKLATGKS